MFPACVGARMLVANVWVFAWLLLDVCVSSVNLEQKDVKIICGHLSLVWPAVLKDLGIKYAMQT